MVSPSSRIDPHVHIQRISDCSIRLDHSVLCKILGDALGLETWRDMKLCVGSEPIAGLMITWTETSETEVGAKRRAPNANP